MRPSIPLSPARRLPFTRLGPVAVAVLALGLAGCDAAGEPTTIGDPDPLATLTESSATAVPDTPTASVPTSAPSSASTAPSSTTPTTAPTSASAPTSIPTFAETAADAPDATGAPASYADAVAHVDALRGGSARRTKRFSTPHDRIYCILGDAVLGTACELRGGAIPDPDVCGGGGGDAVGRIEMTGAGAIPQCNTDTIREPGASTVSPPALITRGPVTCAVEKIGVTCVRESSKDGFFLAAGRYATFG